MSEQFFLKHGDGVFFAGYNRRRSDKRIETMSGEVVPVTGYYIYKGSPFIGEIPAWPDKNENFVVLEKGSETPYLEKGYDHVPAVYSLVVEKKTTPLLHI